MKITESRILTYLTGLFLSTAILTACQIFEPHQQIIHTHPSRDMPISAFGWVGASFSQPMVHETVETAFSISPEVEGEMFWQEGTIWFRPIPAFDPTQAYQAQLTGDLQTEDGKTITVDQKWSFTIREPSLLYFVPGSNGGEIWQADSQGSQQLQITETNSNVFDFTSDRSGSWIAYTVQKESGGSDLWTMDHDGGNQQLLVDCRQDVCGEPAWSMNGADVAYTRESYNPATGGYQPARVWTVDVHTGETTQLYQSEFAFGQSPSFSPDGNKLATYDTFHQAIRILDLQTSQETAIPRVLPGSGDWSSDGSKLIFTDVVPAQNEPFVNIIILDLDTQTLNPAFGEPSTDTDFSQPRWSPSGQWIAASLRPVNANVTKALWVLPLENRFPIIVDDDPTATFSAYQWDPWGQSLVYQRLVLGSADPQNSIWRWDWATKTSKMIIENGVRPQWLP